MNFKLIFQNLFSQNKQEDKLSSLTKIKQTEISNDDETFHLKHISIIKTDIQSDDSSLFLAVSVQFNNENYNRNFIVELKQFDYKIYSYDLDKLSKIFDTELVKLFAKIDFIDQAYFADSQNYFSTNKLQKDKYFNELVKRSSFQKFAIDNDITLDLFKNLNRKFFYFLFFTPVPEHDVHVPLKYLDNILFSLNKNNFEQNIISSAFGEYATMFNNQLILKIISLSFKDKKTIDLSVIKTNAAIVRAYLAIMMVEFITIGIPFFDIDKQLKQIFESESFPKELLSNETFADIIVNDENIVKFFEEYQETFDVDLKTKVISLFPNYVLEAIAYKK